MQIDEEGVVPSRSGSTSSQSINLSEHLIQNGLSANGYGKLEKDIECGEVNVNLLASCTLIDIEKIADEYGLTFTQKTAFINGVKLLPNAKCMVNESSKKELEYVHIFISPTEHSIIDTMQASMQQLNQELCQCDNTNQENKNCIQENIEKLEKMKICLTKTIEDTINEIIKNFENTGYDQETANNVVKYKLESEITALQFYQSEFDKFLKNKNKMTNNEMQTYIHGMKMKLENQQTNCLKIENAEMKNIKIINIDNNMDILKIETFLKQQINDNNKITTKCKEKEEKEEENENKMISAWKCVNCKTMNEVQTQSRCQKCGNNSNSMDHCHKKHVKLDNCLQVVNVFNPDKYEQGESRVTGWHLKNVTNNVINVSSKLFQISDDNGENLGLNVAYDRPFQINVEPNQHVLFTIHVKVPHTIGEYEQVYQLRDNDNSDCILCNILPITYQVGYSAEKAEKINQLCAMGRVTRSQVEQALIKHSWHVRSALIDLASNHSGLFF